MTAREKLEQWVELYIREQNPVAYYECRAEPSTLLDAFAQEVGTVWMVERSDYGTCYEWGPFWSLKAEETHWLTTSEFRDWVKGLSYNGNCRWIEEVAKVASR